MAQKEPELIRDFKLTEIAELEEMSPKMQFIIDSFACYHTPARVFKGINENFGQTESLKLKTISVYKYKYGALIKQRREELNKVLPIMNPSTRFEMAQDIYDDSMIGYPRMIGKGKNSKVVYASDTKTAIQAIKLAHDI